MEPPVFLIVEDFGSGILSICIENSTSSWTPFSTLKTMEKILKTYKSKYNRKYGNPILSTCGSEGPYIYGACLICLSKH